MSNHFKLEPINVLVCELADAHDVRHEQIKAISDYYCEHCNEFWMVENMGLEVEPHGETIVTCPDCGTSDVERCGLD